MEITSFLNRLEKVKKCGKEWTARCPAHDDKRNSLSIGIGDQEKILISCHAGCEAQEIMESLNLKLANLFPTELKHRKFNSITVKDLAESKGFTEEILQDFGVEQTRLGVRIAYYQENGTFASRQRIRTALSAKEGSRWEKGSGKPVPYGLWKLNEAQKAGYVCLVEGESDCWTLWYHQFPCLGLPGADMASKIQKCHLNNIKEIFIVKEPDKGGKTFLAGISKRLKDLNYRGRTFVIEMDDYKDPNELHLKTPLFQKKFSKLIKTAKPISLVKSEVVEYGGLVLSLPKPEDKEVLKLIEESVKKEKVFAIIAPQGSGKSYANSWIAVEELSKGRSVIISSRSHDELNQLGKTIKDLLKAKELPQYHLYHLKGRRAYEDQKEIPDVRPIIVLAPHIYFQFKGETTYHHSLVEMIFQESFGEKPLVLIDEVSSFLESSFISKALGSRESAKKVFGKELWVTHKLCPLFTKTGNCLKCSENMSLVARRGSGGTLNFLPISQRHKEDQISQERASIKDFIKIDEPQVDKPMISYPLTAPRSFEERTWSQGDKQDDQELETTLQNWLTDVIVRVTEPHVVFFYPYDLEKKQIIQRPLNEKELEKRRAGYRIIFPRHVCGVPIVQGWDLAILRKMQEKAQIGLTGPGLSESENYILKTTLKDFKCHRAKVPYVRFQKVLIICLETDLLYGKPEVRNFTKNLTSTTKVLSFFPTYYEAEKADKAISEHVRTMYYDGAQKIRHAQVQGTSIEFDLAISCVHGSLAQGVNLGQFKIAKVSTNCERPKCLFANNPKVKTNKEFIIDDVVEKAKQASLRILRLENQNESPASPRVIIFHGRNSFDVGERIQYSLSEVGHVVKLVHSATSIKFAEDFTLKWLAGHSTDELEKTGVLNFEKQGVLEQIQERISLFQEKHPDAKWREILAGIREVRNLSPLQKSSLKQWFESKYNSQKNSHSDHLKEMIQKITLFWKEHPQAKWTTISRKFHLSRKTKEEREFIKSYFIKT